jgi:hypothetical protein
MHALKRECDCAIKSVEANERMSMPGHYFLDGLAHPVFGDPELPVPTVTKVATPRLLAVSYGVSQKREPRVPALQVRHRLVRGFPVDS